MVIVKKQANITHNITESQWEDKNYMWKIF